MFKQAIIPLLIIAIIASIILPVPAYVMDFLLISNLVLALILLISTLYIVDPLRISSFPTILLLATLFRLALNISSTRLILSSGDAGQAIEAFGSIVIQDNIVVGAVVFLIITLVQFIVIAKGSERVAEVSARFTLDALPGKQMSIDADVRAGLIDMEAARVKRQELQTESRFYGALDGAMKFVKGDAIAGIVICIVNICGGLALGLFSLGLDLNEAVAKYSMLTIGDGLISQIPALLNALAAGLIVTRVTNGDNKPLATEVLSQLGQIKAVKKILGILCLVTAFLPGVPAFPLLVLSAILLVSLAAHAPGAESAVTKLSPQIFQPRIPPPLQIRISKQLAQALLHAKELSERVDALRQDKYEKWGIVLLRPELGALKEDGASMQILIRGVPVYHEKFQVELQTPEFSEKMLAKILDKINAIIDEKIIEFVDDIMTRRCLDNFDKEAPELVSAVVPTVVGVTQLTFILKSLVSDGISIRNFDLILQAVADSGAKAGNERLMLEEVRISLKRLISKNFSEKNYKAVSLQPAIDLAFSKTEKKGENAAMEYLPHLCGQLKEFGGGTAIICSRSSRKLLHECLTARGQDFPVFAFEEILSEVNFTWAGQISVPEGLMEDSLIESLAA
jgi:type III secretion protein V